MLFRTGERVSMGGWCHAAPSSMLTGTRMFTVKRPNYIRGVLRNETKSLFIIVYRYMTYTVGERLE